LRISGALLWATGGEPHRDEVLVSDEEPNGSGPNLILLDRRGRRRAASPEELPKGSVLLLPSEASDEVLAQVRRQGYTARRSALVMLGRDVPASQFVRAAAEALPFVLVKGNGALNLIAELGSPEETASWLADIAAEYDHPVAITLPLGEGTRTLVIAPPLWSEERLKDWVAGYMGELEHIVGEGHFADPAESEDESASPEVPGAPTPAPRATVAAAESELEEVTERLKAELKSRHPKLFDARGRLRTRQYARELSKRTGGRQTLTRTEIVALGKHRTEPTDEASALDAP
jgi:hypothetical protein